MERTYSGDHLLKSTGGSASAGPAISDVMEAKTTVPRRMAPQPSFILVISILPGSSLTLCSEAGGLWSIDRETRRLCSYVFFRRFVRFQITACVSIRLDRTLFAESTRTISV